MFNLNSPIKEEVKEERSRMGSAESGTVDFDLVFKKPRMLHGFELITQNYNKLSYFLSLC